MGAVNISRLMPYESGLFRGEGLAEHRGGVFGTRDSHGQAHVSGQR